MIRKDRLRDAAFAWNALEHAPYAVLAMADQEGKPYCIPVTPGADRAHGVIYLHCAKAGQKLDMMRANPSVCLTAVSEAQSVPTEFEMTFASAVFTGHAEEVTDRAEKVEGLRIICQRYDPDGMYRFEEVVNRLVDGTCVIKIVVEEATGKEAPAKKG